MSFVSVEQLQKTYSGTPVSVLYPGQQKGQPVRALSGVNLDIAAGDLVAQLGAVDPRGYLTLIIAKGNHSAAGLDKSGHQVEQGGLAAAGSAERETNSPFSTARSVATSASQCSVMSGVSRWGPPVSHLALLKSTACMK